MNDREQYLHFNRDASPETAQLWEEWHSLHEKGNRLAWLSFWDLPIVALFLTGNAAVFFFIFLTGNVVRMFTIGGWPWVNWGRKATEEAWKRYRDSQARDRLRRS